MKLYKTVVFIVVLLLVDQGIKAQRLNNFDTLHISKYKDRYVIFSSKMGDLFYHKERGNLTESFPYTSKDLSTGTTTSETFNGTLKNPFSYNIFLIDVFNIEAVSGAHSINGAIGMKTDPNSNGSIYLKGGYGHIFPFNLLKWKHKHFLQLKTSVDLYLINYNDAIGRIDNNDQVINLLGYTASNQFSRFASREGASGTVYNADHINVYFCRRNFIAAPKISLINKPIGKFYWGIETGWFLPVIQRSKLNLIQSDNASDVENKTHRLGKAALDSDGAVTTFNNKSITASPSIAGLFCSLNIGFYL